MTSTLFLIFVLLIVFLFSFLSLMQILRIKSLLKKTPPSPMPYEQMISEARVKILFMGDSLSVGTGSLERDKTVAGRFGQALPSASIRNISENGRKLAGLLACFPKLEKDFGYDLAILQIGANDILKFTPLQTIKSHLREALSRTKEIATDVIVMHSGNVGAAPVFIWPFSQVYKWRTLQVRRIYMSIARELGAHYIDLFSGTSDELFLKQAHLYYSADLIHPSAAGYAKWYDEIRTALQRHKISLE